jgi:hypothetical protein
MKNKLLFVAFFLIADTIFGQEPITDINDITKEYIQYFSNIGFFAAKVVINNGYLPLLNDLHDTDLAVLTKDELRILRNTVYAKNGLIFQSNDLITHFRKFNWYRPQSRNVDGKLTNADKMLIKRIQAFEDAQPNKNLNKRDLVGEWAGGYPPASGSIDNIVINNNNTIEFGYNTMAPRAVLSCKGTYIIENGYLIVLISEQQLHIGDYFDSGWGSTFGSMEGGNVNYGIFKFEKPIRMVFPVGNLKDYIHSDYNDNDYVIGSNIVRQIGSTDRIKN